MGFEGQNDPKLVEPDLKRVLIDEKNYTDPKNLKFRENSLILWWFQGFTKTGKIVKNKGK